MERCAWFVEHGAQSNRLPEIFIRNHPRESEANRRIVLWKIRNGRAACPWRAPGVRVFRAAPDRADRIAPSRRRTTSARHRRAAAGLCRSIRVEKARARLSETP